MLANQQRRVMLVLAKLSGKTGHRGFTLVELMTVLAVIGVLAALGLPNYRIWIENTKIRTAAESIQTGLQKARVEAIKRNVRVQFVLGANSAWTVSCVTAAQCPDLAGGVVETRNANDGSSANITVTATPAGSTTIVFTNLGTVSPASAIAPVVPVPFTQLEFDNSTLGASDSRELRVMIGPGGVGRTCDPYSGLSTTDPRKC